MQHQIYRGIVVRSNTNSKTIVSKDLNFIYRGILYIKSVVKKKPNKILNMIYRGTFYNKFFGL